MVPIALPALEDFISGDEAAAQLGVSYRTYKRYYLDGINGVHLKTVLAGGRKRKTTLKWVREFLAEINAAEIAFLTPEHDEAAERMRAAGILESSQTKEGQE